MWVFSDFDFVITWNIKILYSDTQITCLLYQVISSRFQMALRLEIESNDVFRRFTKQLDPKIFISLIIIWKCLAVSIFKRCQMKICIEKYTRYSTAEVNRFSNSRAHWNIHQRKKTTKYHENDDEWKSLLMQQKLPRGFSWKALSQRLIFYAGWNCFFLQWSRIFMTNNHRITKLKTLHDEW